MPLSETGVFRIPSSPSWMSHRKYFTINFSWMEEFGGIPLHEAMISHGMFPLIVFMLFANMAIILAIKCAAITFIIDFGGNFRARRMLTTFDKTSRPTMTEPTWLAGRTWSWFPSGKTRGGLGLKHSGDPWDELYVRYSGEGVGRGKRAANWPSTLVSTLRLQVRLLNQDITLKVSQASQNWPISHTMDSQPIIYHGDIKTEAEGHAPRAWSLRTM